MHVSINRTGSTSNKKFKKRHLLPLLAVPVDKTMKPLVAGVGDGAGPGGLPASAVCRNKDPEVYLEL